MKPCFPPWNPKPAGKFWKNEDKEDRLFGGCCEVSNPAELDSFQYPLVGISVLAIEAKSRIKYIIRFLVFL
jgi:hypothetical protein